MTEKKKFTKFGNRNMLYNLFFLIPGAIFFCLAWYNFEKNTTLCVLWGGFFLLVIASCAAKDIVMFRNFHCPQCDRKIRKSTNKEPGDPINYYCPDCDIEWETGLYVSSD